MGSQLFDDDERKKPKVDWEGKVKQKDPRGPAIVTSWRQFRIASQDTRQD